MNTTRITGDAQWKPCLNKAAMLIIDIYDYPDKKLTPALQAAKREIPKHWEEGWTRDLPSGLYCTMYLPKMEGELGPLDVCPPALVFRGSEMQHEDISEIAVTADITYTASVQGWGEVASGRAPVPIISANETYSAMQSTQQLRATAGLTEQLLIQPSAGTERLTLEAGWLGDWTLEVAWAGTASLFFGSTGDWPTNISQALGNLPEQYREAIKAARNAAAEAMVDWNGRLMIIGHSLGGGLAATAALAAKSAQPELALRCNTFNASGVHSRTAKEAKSKLSEASAAGISANAVSGDVLTSVQTRGLVPLVSDILRWGFVELPPSIPSSSPNRGVSPGGSPGMMMSGLERAPEWQPLPVLFPLQNQTLVSGDMATLREALGHAASAPDFSHFAGDLIRWLVRGLTGTDNRVNWRLLRDVWQAGFP